MKQYCHYGLIALLVITCFTLASQLFSRGYSAAVYAADRRSTQPILIIDAGHGGEDGGAVAADGSPESGCNLIIAKKLDGLMGLLGYPTSMIRTEDTSLASPDAQSYSEKKVSDLNNRVKQINDTEDAIVISIHQNHFSQPQYRGAQVFYHNCTQSEQLASLTQENLRLALDMTNTRQIKPADGIFLMEQIRHPGILVECGFLSNDAEAQLLRTPGYQNRIAIAIAASVFDYMGEKRI